MTAAAHALLKHLHETLVHSGTQLRAPCSPCPASQLRTRPTPPHHQQQQHHHLSLLPQIYTGGIENLVRVWDLRRDEEPAMVLRGHNDTITGMRLSPDGTHLLTNSMDNTLR